MSVVLDLLVGLLVLVGCSSVSRQAAPHTVAPTRPRPAHTAPSTTATSRPRPTHRAPTPTIIDQPGWTVVSRVQAGIAVDSRLSQQSDGASVAVLRFHAGFVRYALHVGSIDPPTGGVALPADAQPAIGAHEHAQLLAAFNGGFKMTGAGCIPCGVGGMEVAGRVLVPLVTGMTSLVLDHYGRASMGVWGRGFPPAGTSVDGVRQTLPPLVAEGRPSPNVGDVPAWGATLGGGNFTARSAVGIDAHGNVLYAGSMRALPVDMAEALVSAGALTAMELDINPEWVQADTAPSPGGPLSAAVPSQHRPADQYLSGWTRDYVTVLAGP